MVPATASHSPHMCGPRALGASAQPHAVLLLYESAKCVASVVEATMLPFQCHSVRSKPCLSLSSNALCHLALPLRLREVLWRTRPSDARTASRLKILAFMRPTSRSILLGVRRPDGTPR